MSKLSRIVLGTFGAACVLALAHARLNRGVDPLRSLGLSKEKEVAQETRFRVGFLPVT
ncbi:MAG TPA: hypothetical protein VE685_19775 [Thermoanaerobaculia bacterium]|nr:hypothetical protein [Thermoanaerobaculia bacterium]